MRPSTQMGVASPEKLRANGKSKPKTKKKIKGSAALGTRDARSSTAMLKPSSRLKQSEVQRMERLRELKKGGQHADDILMTSSRPSAAHLIDYRVYYRPMKGINLRKKVNFSRQVAPQGELQGQPVISLVELRGDPTDPNAEV